MGFVMNEIENSFAFVKNIYGAVKDALRSI